MTALLTLMLLAFLQQKPQPQFVGAEQCAVCHEDIGIGLKKNAHWKLEQRPAGSCESCHGAGSDHAGTGDIANIRSFKMLGSQEIAAACLDCHKHDTHSNRLFDAHARSAISCTMCHSIHRGTTPANTVASNWSSRSSALSSPSLASARSTCTGCHAAEAAKFNRPFGHKLERSAMDCVSCHAPHGSPQKSQLMTTHSNQNGCLTCHGDKRGPFAFEHMPVKVSGCAACHEPHGSSNPRMLVRHEVRQVCLECHTNSTSAFGKTPPAFHDLRSDRFRNCTLCHTKVHGSHTSPALLR